MIELDGESNSVEFWSQSQAIEELRRQVAIRIGGARKAQLEAKLEGLHARFETPFGVYETKQIIAIVVSLQ